jgi:hypothetical protein
MLGGAEENVPKGISWALRVFDPFFSKTALGMPGQCCFARSSLPELAAS